MGELDTIMVWKENVINLNRIRYHTEIIQKSFLKLNQRWAFRNANHVSLFMF